MSEPVLNRRAVAMIEAQKRIDEEEEVEAIVALCKHVRDKYGSGRLNSELKQLMLEENRN